MVQCIATFLDVCYLVHHADINEDTIAELQMAIVWFHEYREIFRVHGVRPRGFSLPHQHSLIHYPHQIREFGAPAGLCSSITELQHITAVKRPWRCSNHHDALGRCCSQTSALTNSTPHATISCIEACSLPPILLHQSLYYCMKKTRMHNQSTNM